MIKSILVFATVMSSRASLAAQEMIGGVRRSHLESAITTQDRFGTSTLQVSTEGSARSDEAALWIRRGILYLHAFHWTKAARALNAAIRIEPNPVAYSLLALAYIQIESEPAYARLAAETALMSVLAITPEESQLLKTVHRYTCRLSKDLCGLSDVGVKEPNEIAKEAIDSGSLQQPDYLALFGWLAFDEASLLASHRQEPGNAGANHYLTHYRETFGNIKEALGFAKYYASQALDSAHAQHMFGHILPQVGRWEEAAEQFKTAHELHLKEFMNDGLLPSEEWHYGHNLSLYSATQSFLGRASSAYALTLPICLQMNEPYICLTPAQLAVITGDLNQAVQLANKIMAYKEFEPLVLNIQLLAGLAAGDKSLVDATFAKVTEKGLTESPYLLSGRVAHAVHQGEGDAIIEDLLSRLEAVVKRPGFDSWTGGVMQIRMLGSVLQQMGETDLAGRVDRIPIGPGQHEH